MMSAIRSKWDSEFERSKTEVKKLRTRWWLHPYVVGRINQRIGGRFAAGPNTGMQMLIRSKYLDRLPYRRGISVGGAAGHKEMNLIRDGIVKHMTVYELSPARIEQGRRVAVQRGLSDAIEFVYGDAFDQETMPGQYDFVHWDNSLHHMFDVRAAIEWSATMLCEDGLFYMNDFVGPTYFQWTTSMLELATEVRSTLPAEYLINPSDPSKSVERVFSAPPSIDSITSKDPSEAADSGRIIEVVRGTFPDAKIIPTGGVVYSMALNDIIHNFSAEPVDPLLPVLMMLDFQAADAGLTHYAAAIAAK